MYLITGITGHVGGAAATRLLELGHTVRTIARDPAKAAAWAEKGVEIVKGDFTNVDSISTALEGVEGAYLMMPPTLTPSPGFPESRAIIASFAEALSQTPPPKLVLLSSVGSEKESGLGLITSTHLLEEGIGNLNIPTAIVRAGGFFENSLGAVPTAVATGILYSFYQPTPVRRPMVATVDIGNTVAELLISDWTGKKIIELGSLVSPDDIASAVSEVLGKPIKAQAIPRDQWPTILQGFGIPAGQSGPYEEMTDSFNSGWINFGVPGTEPVAGKTKPIEAFAQLLRG